MTRRTSKWRAGGSVIGILALVGAMSIGVVGVSSSVAGARTAKVKIPSYKNKLTANTNGWCTPAQGCNGQAGGASDYGTISIVKSSYSNYGGYGANTPSPTGKSKFARITGAGVDQDTINGCPTPGYDASLNVPYCQGPYVCYLGSCAAAVFPTNGFTSSVMVYVDPTWAAANPGQQVDWDVGLNNTSGAYLSDNGFTMCTTTAGGGGFYVNLNQFGGCNPSAEELTAAGWYTLKQVFQSVAGQIVVTYSVTPAGGPAWTSVVNTGEPTSGTGGPSYLWFADEDALGLPVAQVSLKNN